ncbi:MAG TPA: hypothetical protein VGM07_19365 [Stellaceae bacterium]
MQNGSREEHTREAFPIHFGAILAAVGFSTTCEAADEPQGGSYVVSGNVTAATAVGGATCIAKGKTITGYSYFPGVQGKGKNFTVIIPPASSDPGIVYQFPAMNRFSGSVWRDTLVYLLPPATTTANATFSLAFTAYNANSFTITFAD